MTFRLHLICESRGFYFVTDVKGFSSEVYTSFGLTVDIIVGIGIIFVINILVFLFLAVVVDSVITNNKNCS